MGVAQKSPRNIFSPQIDMQTVIMNPANGN